MTPSARSRRLHPQRWAALAVLLGLLCAPGTASASCGDYGDHESPGTPCRGPSCERGKAPAPAPVAPEPSAPRDADALAEALSATRPPAASPFAAPPADAHTVERPCPVFRPPRRVAPASA